MGLDHDSQIEDEGAAGAQEVRQSFEEILRSAIRRVEKDGEDVGEVAGEGEHKE